MRVTFRPQYGLHQTDTALRTVWKMGVLVAKVDHCLCRYADAGLPCYRVPITAARWPDSHRTRRPITRKSRKPQVWIDPPAHCPKVPADWFQQAPSSDHCPPRSGDRNYTWCTVVSCVLKGLQTRKTGMALLLFCNFCTFCILFGFPIHLMQY